MTKALAIVIALLALLSVYLWGGQQSLKAEKAAVETKFATYRETAERQAREALAREAATAARVTQQRQEALDVAHRERLDLQASADRLRGTNGQLQRYVADLSTSLGDRAASGPAAGSCSPAFAALDLSAQLLGGVDDAAAEIAQYADQVRAASGLCISTFNAVRPQP